jgi:hypothetical protein
MFRKLKLHGVVSVAALAITGLSASAASGAEFKASEYNVLYHATNNGAHTVKPGVNEPLSCNSVTFFEQEIYSGPSKTVTFTPHYTNCTFLGVSTTVNTNECAYLLTQPTGGGQF